MRFLCGRTEMEVPLTTVSHERGTILETISLIFSGTQYSTLAPVSTSVIFLVYTRDAVPMTAICRLHHLQLRPKRTHLGLLSSLPGLQTQLLKGTLLFPDVGSSHLHHKCLYTLLENGSVQASMDTCLFKTTISLYSFWEVFNFHYLKCPYSQMLHISFVAHSV